MTPRRASRPRRRGRWCAHVTAKAGRAHQRAISTGQTPLGDLVPAGCSGCDQQAADLVRKLAMHRPAALETIWFLAASRRRWLPPRIAVESRPALVPTRRTKRCRGVIEFAECQVEAALDPGPCPSTCRSSGGGGALGRNHKSPSRAPVVGVGHGAVREDPIEHRHGSELARPGPMMATGDRRFGLGDRHVVACTRARTAPRWQNISAFHEPGPTARRRESPLAV